jgi:hypothetical protein
MKEVCIKSLLLVLLFSLTGCTELPVSSVRKVDPKLESQVSELEGILGITVNYSVQFAKLEGDTIGRCHRSIVGSLVVIDEQYYENNKDVPLSIEGLLLHEIMHCSFGFAHDDAYFSSTSAVLPFLRGCPVTVMNSEYRESCYELNRDYYITEILERIRGS